MIAFIFTGKNSSADYQLGAYVALKKNHINPSLIVGVKVGALNAAMITSNNLKKLESLWSDISFREIVNSNFLINDSIENTISSSFTEIYKDIKNMNSYRAIVRNNINVDSIKASKIKCIVSTLKLGNMKSDIVTLNDSKEYDIHDYITSSLLNSNYEFDNIDLSHYDNVYIINSGEDVINVQKDWLEIKNLKYGLESYYMVGYLDTLKILNKVNGNDYYFELKNDAYFKNANKKVTSNIYEKVSKVLNTSSYKQTVIKACEYILKSENSKVDTIYKFKSILKHVKKINNNDLVYNYVKLLKL